MKHHVLHIPLDGFNELPAFRLQAPANDRTSSKPQLADSESKGEFYALENSKPVRNNLFSPGHLLRGCGAYLHRFLFPSKIGRVTEINANTHVGARKSLEKVLGLDTEGGVVNQGKSTGLDAIVLPSCVTEGLDDEQNVLAHQMYKFVKSRCYETLLVIARPSNRQYLGLINALVYSHGSQPVFALPIGQHEVDSATGQPSLVYPIIVGVLCVLNIAVAASIASSWIYLRLEATGYTPLLDIGTVLLSILTMTVLYDTKHFPMFSLFLMLPSSFIHYAAMVYKFRRMLNYSQRYVPICIFVTSSLLVIASIVLARFGTPFSESLAAIPLLLPASAWMVYNFTPLQQLQVALAVPLDNMAGLASDPVQTDTNPVLPTEQGTTADHSSV